MLKKVTITMIILVTIIGCMGMSSSSDENAEVNHILYSTDGRAFQCPESLVPTYLNLNWYTVPSTILYAADGREQVFGNSIVDACLAVGWYRTKEEANTAWEEAHKPKVNENDVLLLAKLIYGEAADNSYDDRCYVARVVINRVNSSAFPNSISGVIYQGNGKQYSCIHGSKFNSNPPQQCIDIARACLMGETFGVPSNVVYQAQFRQGSGVWKKVGVHYYCYR